MTIAPPLLAGALLLIAEAWTSSASAQESRGRISECTSLNLSGSYVLVGNLASSASGDCLKVGSSFVSIDLNGFTIFGSGMGAGITNEGETSNITVRNGKVNHFAVGISLGDHSVVQDISADSNSTGIEVGENSTVSGSTAIANERGLVVKHGSIVAGNKAFFNSDVGILVRDFSIVSGNDASQRPRCRNTKWGRDSCRQG